MTNTLVEFKDLPESVRLYFEKSVSSLKDGVHGNLPIRLRYYKTRYATYYMQAMFMSGTHPIYGFVYAVDFNGNQREVKMVVNWHGKMQSGGVIKTW